MVSYLSQHYKEQPGVVRGVVNGCICGDVSAVGDLVKALDLEK